MPIVTVIAGVVVILLVTYDVIQTALRLGQRGGPLTLHLASRLWRLALRFPRLLDAAGVVILVGIVLMWILFNWLGWSLVFSSHDSAVVGSHTGAPADLVGRIYFAGYTIFTLGNGDYQPLGGWRIVTGVANATGLMLVTLSITYLVPLLSAVVEKRSLGGRISLLGDDLDEVVENLARDETGEGLGEVSSFPEHLLLLKERHLAYPVLHYFQSRDRDSAIAVNLAVVSDALSLICDGSVEPDPRLQAVEAKFSRALGRLLASLEPWFVTDEPDPPPRPPLDVLRRAGIAPRPEEEYRARSSAREDLRRRLLWMVRDTGWSWPVARDAEERAAR